jgi:galactonate dehydratase
MMKITAVDPFLVPPGWLFVRIRTDDGITGWGEAGASAHHLAVAAAVRELSEFLVGTSPSQIEHHWQTIRKVGFFRGGSIASSAGAAIDCALWDIAGRMHGAPVHELVGGPVRDALRAFASIGDADEARDCVAMGFTAFTLRLETSTETSSVLLPLVEAVRSAIGADNDLAVDCGGRLSLVSARHLLPLLEPYRLLVLNEPVRGAPPHVLADLARRSGVPLSVGRRLYSRWDLQPALAIGLAGVDVDVAAAGGISETRRVAVLAETHQIRVSLASNYGPLALAASLQVGFSTANILGQAWSAAGSCAGADYVSSPFGQVEGGCYNRPDVPGLGVAIDEPAVTRAAACTS